MSIHEKRTFSVDVGGSPLRLEISSLAERASAAVLARHGETAVLVTVVVGKKDADVNYVPLRVDYEERFYAAGKIIGSRFIRREGRPSEEAILTGRLVDRAIRPLFPKHLRREVQVVATVLAYDEEHDPDFPGLIAASVALGISEAPWNGPVGGVRVALVDGKEILAPTRTQIERASCHSFVAGVQGKINMVEFEGREASEEQVLALFACAQKEIDKLVDFQRKIIAELGKQKLEVVPPSHPELEREVQEFLAPRMEAAVFHSQIAGEGGLASLKEELRAHLEARIKEGALPPDTNLKNADLLFEDAVDAFVHKSILEEERRPDGRKLDEVRQLEGAVGIFSRNHGSAIFVRGSTQAFAVTTLAPPGAEQLIETMEMSGKRRFMLHYNFPAYSVGEIGAFRSPGRREIGHGALAEKAVKYVLPPQEKFPYTIRVVSEILSSNGSSSMATVCAGTLSLMDAGVPIARPVAGIAMGLMKDEKGNYKILTDIQGPEDHHGDMDFKVAGTERGITAIQMDVKVEGVPHKILREALVQAKKARNEILSFMRTVIAAPRPQLSPLVPKIVRLHIDPDKIGLVIGAGGKTINSLIAKTGVQSIDLEEDGSVYIAADDMEKAHAAAKEIEMMTKEFHEGDIVEGRVSKILDFGAIVDLGGGQDGMVHVSELKNGYVKEVSDVVKEGDVVKAKVIKVDPATGRIGLSLKRLDAEHGKKSRHTQ